MTEIPKDCHLYFGQNWHTHTHPAAWSLCDSWATCYSVTVYICSISDVL